VARAKRTERAEARRRYRAAAVADPETEGAESSTQPTSGAKATAGSTAKASAGQPVRTSFTAAFRQSFRPIHVRQDVAAVPWLATHTHALWVPLVLTVASTVLTAATGATDTVPLLLFTYFVMFPAIGSMFIVGFLAPRASWLLGIIVGLVSAVCYIALGLNGKLPVETQTLWAVSPQGAIVTSLVYSAFFGAFFAAGAAWYRRFLKLSSPNRGKASQAAKQKPGDGRTRAGTTQKAGAKR
jgi:hypothetical protein